MSDSTFIFNIAVAKTENQTIVTENLELSPELPYEESLEPIVNNRYLKVNVPPGQFKLSYRSQVDVTYVDQDPNQIPETLPSDLPVEILKYIYPSRYCESDRLLRLAQSEFSHLQPGYSRVTAICNWIYDHVTYLSGSTNSQTSAFNTVTERTGVCRDFAHLAIALCRALNIPARFAAGYAYNLVPPDFHAYFEAYLGGRWYLFDATRLVPLEGLIRIGTGRDAADVSFATIFGAIELTKMQLLVNSLDEEKPEATTDAISPA
ncbi:transglutaminase-like enzyme, predicted cysteine protease [Gloeocapsa sp. PCC 73106]|nr:transglutaminase family protein [Gloeocapsa sp. PCC 73106]ELR98733.1 transglutaminase-like enzyme, predicted cysteine protease [Gloeocapsa sp. PCC 73106]